MKFNYKGNDFESSVDRHQHFGAKVDAKFWHAVFDGLYSNKENSIIRELWANAYDAHIEAGIGDKPFEVKLPSSFDPTFSVRDFGSGLNQEFMKTRYPVAFDSTKDDSDVSVGGWGIGRLSVFSYTDQYTVVSRCEGIKSTYAISKDRSGGPVSTLLHSVSSEEPSGLEVTFPVKAMEVRKFEREAMAVALGHDVKPRVINRTDWVWPTLEIRSEGNGYRFYNPPNAYGVPTHRGALAKMGCVVYPIDRNRFSSEKYSTLLTENIIIDFGIGELAVTVSRESLSYSVNEPTVQSILRKIESILSTMANDFSKTLQKEDNEYDAIHKLYRKPRILAREKDFYWWGKRIGTRPFHFHYLSVSSDLNRFFNSRGLNCSYDKPSLIILENKRKGERDLRGPSRISQYLTANPAKGTTLWIRLQYSDKAREENQELLDLLNFLGWPEVIAVKDMPDTKVASTVNRRGVSVWTLTRELQQESSVDLSEKEMEKGGYYLKYYKNNPLSEYFQSGRTYYDKRKNLELFSACKSAGLITTNDSLYKVPKPLWKKFEEDQWVELGEEIAKFLSKYKDTFRSRLVTPSELTNLQGYSHLIPEVRLSLEYIQETNRKNSIPEGSGDLLSLFVSPKQFDFDLKACYTKYPILPLAKASTYRDTKSAVAYYLRQTHELNQLKEKLHAKT